MSWDDITKAEKVTEFMEGFGQEVKTTVEWPDEKTVRLRVRLMCEEFIETLLALMHGDMVKVADGLIDSEYVQVGTALAFGIPYDYIFDIIHENNMSKFHYTDTFEPYVKRDEFGKVVKPLNFKPIDGQLLEVLKENGYDPNDKPNFDIQQLLLEETAKFGINLLHGK